MSLTYWLALVLVVATIGAIYRLLRSTQGLALAAVRDNEQAARAVGVDARRHRRRWSISTAAFVTGLAGALIYVQKARISPDAAFSVTDWTAYVIFIVVIGGIGTIEGPIVGVIVFFLLQNLLADYGSWYLLIARSARHRRRCCSRRAGSGACSPTAPASSFSRSAAVLKGGPLDHTHKGEPNG